MIQDDFRQSHFILYELELPYCSVCTSTLSDGSIWNTPVTCEESSDSTYKLYFTSNKAPLIQQPTPSIGGKSILNSKVFRCVDSATESTARLKLGEGLASRSMMSIKCTDFKGDPGPLNFSDEGTFFGKLMARNVLNGKKIVSRYYSIAGNSSAPVEVYTATHYIESVQLTNNVFSISAKDALKDIEGLTQQFPQPSALVLSADINDSTTTIPMASTTGLAANNVIRIDDELMVVSSVDSSTSITVGARGATIVGVSQNISKTRKDAHTSGATVQPCYVMNDSFLPDVLQDIFTSAGLSSFVDYAQWSTEITAWNQDAKLYGVFHTPDDVDKIINKMCTDYMVDIWLDQPSQKVKVGSTTPWKITDRSLYEGDDFSKLKSSINSAGRFSRAYIYNGKEYKTANDDLVNYSTLTLATDTNSESSDLNGDIKLKVFEPSDFITAASATILVNRFISRFSKAPKTLTFEMEERKAAGLELGDVIDLYSRDNQSPSGQVVAVKDRAQVVKIQPNLNGVGRTYNVAAVTYIPQFEDDNTIVITGPSVTTNVDLYAQTGGRPGPIDVTLILDGAIIGSSGKDIPAIDAGALHPDSTVTIICTNGTKWSAKGGNGGDAGNNGATEFAENGEYGANSYESRGIATEIYLNYGTVLGYATDCELYAAGGGGGAAASMSSGSKYQVSAMAGGGGGNGIPTGSGGVVRYQDLNRENTKKDHKNGVSGSFTSAGAGASTFAGLGLSFHSADSAVGGYSENGGDGISNGTGANPEGSGGIAGGAFKGANITVYNLAAHASKLKDGNSDSYTLIDA